MYNHKKIMMVTVLIFSIFFTENFSIAKEEVEKNANLFNSAIVASADKESGNEGKIDKEVKLIINSVNTRLDDMPFIQDNRTYVPLRYIFERLGAMVIWNGEDQSIDAYSVGKEIHLQINNNTAVVNGAVINLDASPLIKNNRTYVPVRFVAESLGAKVDWDSDNHAVSIQIDLLSDKYTQEQKEWALGTAAILCQLNRGQYDKIGFVDLLSINIQIIKNSLKDSWGITNREEALEIMNWLKNNGHRKSFYDQLSYLSHLSAEDFELYMESMKSDLQTYGFLNLIKKRLIDSDWNVDKLVDKDLMAWDYGRLVNVIGWSYVAGYISKEEAWYEIMKAAEIVQQSFESWEEMGLDYALGRYYWSKSFDMHIQCVASVNLILEDQNSPWNKYPWDMDLGSGVNN